MRVLVACEFSATVREAFASRGHDAWSCDLLPSDRGGKHLQGDVLRILNDDWDLMIGHPPCTYLCNSGVRWLHTELGRWDKMRKAAEFFLALFRAPIPRICVENPIMHGYGTTIIGARATQIIQPWMFGHGETKATGLWLRGLPPLTPTRRVKGRQQKVHLASPGPNRWKVRSVTFKGIARAMSQQWGGE